MYNNIIKSNSKANQGTLFLVGPAPGNWKTPMQFNMCLWVLPPPLPAAVCVQSEAVCHRLSMCGEPQCGLCPSHPSNPLVVLAPSQTTLQTPHTPAPPYPLYTPPQYSPHSTHAQITPSICSQSPPPSPAASIPNVPIPHHQRLTQPQ